MPNVLFNSVTLAFTQNMSMESEYGNGYNYSFIIDKNTFIEKVTGALKKQTKGFSWREDELTEENILSRSGAKSRDVVTYEPVKAMMSDNDILVQVKDKNNPIKNDLGKALNRGTVANILVDVFAFDYSKKKFICIRSHSDRGLTVQVVKLVERESMYFTDKSCGSNCSGVNMDEIDLASSNCLSQDDVDELLV